MNTILEIQVPIKMEAKEFWDELYNSPRQCHRLIVAQGSKNLLMAWIQNICIRRKQSLVMFPDTEREVNKWKIVARTAIQYILDNTDIPKDYKDLEVIRKGMDKSFHVCRAHKRKLYDGRIINIAMCYKRLDRLFKGDRAQAKTVKQQYNEWVRIESSKEGNVCMDMFEWLRAFKPVEFNIWAEQYDKRMKG